MKNLIDFALREKYEKVKELRSRLEEMKNLIDWDAFLPIFPDKETLRGRPEYEKKLMIKILFLQSCYGIIIKKGAIQDAAFIQADPGKKKSGMSGRGREAKTSRSKDGSWTKKGKKSIFGFKAHHKVDEETKIITEVAVSTAKTFDGNLDLAKEDGSMKRGKLSPHENLRNRRIAKKRCRGEHPYGTMHRSFKAGKTKLTTITRVFVQHVFVCIAYNVHRLGFLLKKPSGSSI